MDMIPYNPDGTPVTRRGVPYRVPPRRDERRQLQSLARSAWATRKGVPQPVPEGATVRIGDDPEPAFRMERVPVIVLDQVVDTRLDWVDLREQRRQAAEAKALEEARRKHASSKKSHAETKLSGGPS